MARLVCCLLLILLPVAAAISDPAGDPSQRVGSQPVDAPAIDLRNVTGTLVDGVFDVRIETWGDLLIGDQAPDGDPNRTYTYLFIVALDASAEANLYEHISKGGDTVTIVCVYHEGQFDLTCQITQGEGVLRSTGAVGRNVTARFSLDFSGPYAVGGSSHVSIPNGTDQEILAQDFTSNALPYQGLPSGGEVAGPEPVDERPWWRSGWLVFAGIAVAIFVIGMVVPWEWFDPTHWRRR